ncbi:uncharacterized protein LOC120355022 [Nilaparvata lugens]|uniref:uncharacterized protein LOC120355022 n=1 Tax=Nilaparvata lugens TaxID=108931 RepID=UPI00193DA894|nr:uncharacterized protein LOC120355022 [Nilaparvata lugens]
MCVKLGETEIEELSARPAGWTCNKCLNKLRAERSKNDSTPVRTSSTTNISAGSIVTLESLNNSLEELKAIFSASQQSLKEELFSAIGACTAKMNENFATLSAQAQLIKDQQTTINELLSENATLNKRLDAVELHADRNEQYSRRNLLEIHGIPSIPNEDVVGTVLSVCRSVGLDFKRQSIIGCHRLKKRNNRPSAGIVVKFLCRDDAEALLQKRKVKHNLNTEHIGIGGQAMPIYINRSMTERRRQLFAKAKKLQRDKGFRYVWADRNGTLKIRPTEGGRIFVVNSEEDLRCFQADSAGNGGSDGCTDNRSTDK